MKIFNTLTRQKEELRPLNENEVNIYACGPTVYNYFHLGNARPLVNFDTLRRYLEYKGNKVNFVQNFTDIDDKVINKANEEGKTIYEVSDFYIEQYFVDADGLNVRRSTVHPRATDYIDGMIDMIQTLADKGFAYVAKDGVYYDTSKFNSYLGLSGFSRNQLLDNVRVDVNEASGKRDYADFVLWKFKKEGEPAWESPWGEGRPGWHIECSVMSTQNLGNTIDIHCGGRDLIFPHHENEIAQSEAATGSKFANYWMHNGFITIDNEKMSKSENNFFLIREIAGEYGYMPIRMFLLNSHYRTPINYSIEMINSSKNSYERLVTCYDNLEYILKNQVFDSESDSVREQEEQLTALAEKTITHFETAMDDDLNTADALGAIFELVKETNIAMQTPLSELGFRKVYEVLFELTDVLGVNLALNSKDVDNELTDKVWDLVEKRAAAKENKDYALADQLRDEIAELGYRVVDTAQGVKIEVIE